MEDLRLTYNDLFFYAVVVSVVISIFFGFFPLVAGLKLKNAKLGLIGFFGSAVLGLIGVVFAFPFALGMQWLILRGSGAAAATVPATVENHPALDS